MKIKLATVFSGIGAIEFALKRLKIDHELIFACDNGEREIEYDHEKEYNSIINMDSIDEKKEYVEELYTKNTRKINYMQKSYLENYPELPSNRFFQDIKLLDGRDFANTVDLFVGGSPCQSFSTVGYQKGLEDARGTLFYEYARLIKEIKPKIFIYENVRGLTTHDNGNTWEIIQGIFNSLGYKVSTKILNSVDFGIPQNRRRIFIIGTIENIDFSFDNINKKELKLSLQDLLMENCDYGDFNMDEEGNIIVKKSRGVVEKRYELTPGVLKYVMKGGTKNFYQKPEIDLKIARPILKTMGNHHRAGTDNYITVDKETSRYRQLTERETHRLMGFTDDYKIVVSRAMGYKQSGNSIVVDVLMSILMELINKDAFGEE
jgi:DNA (cytosine-5)-methyltransferase 1